MLTYAYVCMQLTAMRRMRDAHEKTNFIMRRADLLLASLRVEVMVSTTRAAMDKTSTNRHDGVTRLHKANEAAAKAVQRAKEETAKAVQLRGPEAAEAVQRAEEEAAEAVQRAKEEATRTTRSHYDNLAESAACVEVLAELCASAVEVDVIYARALVTSGVAPLLASCLGNPHERVSAAKGLTHIAGDPRVRRCVTEAGGLSHLVHMVYTRSFDTGATACETIAALMYDKTPDGMAVIKELVDQGMIGAVAPLISGMDRVRELYNVGAEAAKELRDGAVILLNTLASRIVTWQSHVYTNDDDKIDWSSLRGSNVFDSLVELMNESDPVMRPLAAQTLHDFSVCDMALQVQMAHIFAASIAKEELMIKWFDVVRALAAMACFAKRSPEYPAIAAGPLTKFAGTSVTLMEFPTKEDFVLLALADIGAMREHMQTVVLSLIQAVHNTVSLCVQDRIVAILSAITARSTRRIETVHNLGCEPTDIPGVAIETLVTTLMYLLETNHIGLTVRSVIECMYNLLTRWDCVDILVANGALEPLMWIRRGTSIARQSAANILAEFAARCRDAATIALMGGVLPFAQLLDSADRDSYFGARALAAVAAYPECAKEMLDAEILQRIIRTAIDLPTYDNTGEVSPSGVSAPRDTHESLSHPIRAWSVVALAAFVSNGESQDSVILALLGPLGTILTTVTIDKAKRTGSILADVLRYIIAGIPTYDDDLKMELARAFLEALRRQSSRNQSGLRRANATREILLQLMATAPPSVVPYAEAAMDELYECGDKRKRREML